MAAFVLTDASVVINTTSDLSDHVRAVTINYKAEAPEDTAMGVTAKQRLGGLTDWSIDVELNQDYADTEIDDILFPLLGVAATIVVKPTSGALAATNPGFTGTGILSDYDPIAGKVGDVAIAKCKFMGSGLLDRDVTP